MHAEAIVFPFAPNFHRVVEIARIVAVDGDDQAVAEIPPPADFDLFRGNALCLGERLMREFFRQIFRTDDGVLLAGKIAALPQNFGNFAHGFAALGIIQNFDQNLFAAVRAHFRARHAHVVKKTTLVGLYVPALLFLEIGTHDLGIAAAYNAVNFSLVPAAHAACEHGVAVHGAVQGAVRNEQIALFAHQKGKAALVAAQHAFVQSERRGQNVAVFLVAHDRALLFERTKDAVYRLALALLRDAQKPRDLARRLVCEFARSEFFFYLLCSGHKFS